MNLLDVASGFDWISPLIALINDAKNGAADFGVPGAVAPRTIKGILRPYNIPVWGFQLSLDNSILMFTVSPADAVDVEKLLKYNRVSIMYSPVKR